MGVKYEIRNNHIVSFEMETKFQYKNCSVTIKKNDRVYVIDCVIISKEGYIVEISEAFLAKNRIYPCIINYLNNIIDNDLDVVYQKLINKKGFIDKLK